MNVRLTIQGIPFEWDMLKAKVNFRKHGISFELATEAFFDPFVSYQNGEVIDGELRETIAGLTSNWQLVCVVYVLRDDIIRIISTRLATNAERLAYENR